jgi:Domain of unknown function DUF11/Kelch motif/Galactose oxidase, central domain
MNRTSKSMKAISWLAALSIAGLTTASMGARPQPAVKTVPDAIGTSRATGAMATVRSRHTLTLLASGRVLAVGGADPEGVALASAEIFDPATGQWAPAGSLLEARMDHTATLLPSGKVLVAGGGTAAAILGSAEIYDPRTDDWTSAPGSELLTARWGHTATVLLDGEVLVAGGSGAGGPLDGVELYDPESGTWREARAMASARDRHTATLLLPSGKVLVCGGSDGSGVPAGAEVYDPSTDTWTATSTGMLTRRSRHTATLLPEGGVLIAGGLDAGGSTLAAAERYDPETGQWSPAGQSSPRHSHRANLLPSGQVVVSGGFDGTAGSRSIELYDATVGWSAAGELGAARLGHAAILLPSGAVLMAGGELEASAEIYELATAGWTSTPGRLTGAPTPSVTQLASGRILVSGAVSYGTQAAELYDPQSNAWLPAPSPPCFRLEGAASVLLPSGEALVAGGIYNAAFPLNSPRNCVDVYDPDLEDGTWRGVSHLNVARSRHSITLLASGKVLVAGGRSGVPLRSVEVYDPETETWTLLAGSLAEARHGHTATLLTSGEVLVVGGEGSAGILTSAEVFDPASGAWRTVGSLALRRTRHTATLLPSGRVLVAGGNGTGPRASAELYDPATESWASAGSLAVPRTGHAATLLSSGRVLVSGGTGTGGALASAELYDPAVDAWTVVEALSGGRSGHRSLLTVSGQVLVVGGGEDGELFGPPASSAPRPLLLAAPTSIAFGVPFDVSGSFFDGVSEAGDGTRQGAAVNHPLVQLQAIENGALVRLRPDPRSDLGADPTILTVSELPDSLQPGWYHLTVTTAGVTSWSKLVRLECSLAVTRQPESQTVPLGETATFTVEAQGERTIQWRKNGEELPGATGATYTTPPADLSDSGDVYDAVLSNGCTSVVSAPATLIVGDDQSPPEVEVLTPSGGEFWLLSSPEAGGEPRSELIAWSMSDDTLICRVRIALTFSNDGGATYVEAAAGGGLPAVFGPGGACAPPGEDAASTRYVLPTSSPSGQTGSLYKIEVRVRDRAGRETVASSLEPFFIVKPNNETVRTLILTDFERLQSRQGASDQELDDLAYRLRNLAGHPRVQGVVANLGDVPQLAPLFAAWDQAGPATANQKANDVLFAPGGVHDYILDLLEVFTGVRHLVLVGDDRILPMARLPDRTYLLPESRYLESGDLTAGSTVGRALAADAYLSDDPLAVLDVVRTVDLATSFFLPDLAVGRLVETPAEMATAIATFLAEEGAVDLDVTTRPVLVTGYDFLRDAGQRIRDRWGSALGAPPEELLEPGWGLGSVEARRAALRARLAEGYSIVSLNGHATHYEEGIPGNGPLDVQGLPSPSVYGTDACSSPSVGGLDLGGGVFYSTGCHGGLPVPGSCFADADRSLDLPQSVLARGASAWIANTGYGWGLVHGVGYGERLAELLTIELTSAGTVTLGEAVQRAKQLYYLESLHFDPYAQKSAMQWTLFGLPMTTILTGIDDGDGGAAQAAPLKAVSERPGVESFGGARVARGLSQGSDKDSALPAFLTRLDLRFDFNADGVLRKLDSSGNEVSAPGCPDPAGCLVTLNGLSSAVADVPVQPYFVYDTRLAATSQHGVLWLGGDYVEEEGWTPIVAELASNVDYDHELGSTPRNLYIKPTTPRFVPGEDPPGCRSSDLEQNRVVVAAGEAVRPIGDAEGSFSIQRTYRDLDLEVFYFNDILEPGRNCDRTGPTLAPAATAIAYHQVQGGSIDWAVAAGDSSGVWRVVVVANDNTVDSSGRGTWFPIELADGGDGIWRGSLSGIDSPLLTYVIQAVDRRGNVAWLEFVSTELPESGIALEVPESVDVELTSGAVDLSVDAAVRPDPVLVGNPLRADVRVENHGPDGASNVMVTATLPAGSMDPVAGGSGWQCAVSASEAVCTRAALEPGEVATLSVVVMAPAVAGDATCTVAASAAEVDVHPLDNAVSVSSKVVDAPNGC